MRVVTGPRIAMVVSLVITAVAMVAAIRASDHRSDPVPPETLPPELTEDPAQIEAARRQTGLATAEDERVLAQVRGILWNWGPYVDRDHGQPTIILTGAFTYDLNSLVSLGAARWVDPRTVELTTSVLVGPSAKLVIHAPGVTLRMVSSAAGFTSLVGWRGEIELTGDIDAPLAISSWDPATAEADRRVEDGRAYIRVGGGSIRTRFAQLSHLGFWSGRTGGLALTGTSSGHTTGSIADTTIRASHYGLFSSEAHDLTVTSSAFEDNTADGIMVHRDSVNVVVRDTVARGNAGSGVAVSRGASNVTLSGVTALANAADGIQLDGRPIAERPGVSGESLDGHRGFQVLESESRDNRGQGIHAWDTDDLVLSRNLVTGNTEGIVLQGATRRAQVTSNRVQNSSRVAIAVRDGGSDVAVVQNTVDGADTGIQVRNAKVDIRENIVTAANNHGISVQGASHGSAVVGNAIAGRGSSAVDLARLDANAVVEASANSGEGWEITMDVATRLETVARRYPLLPLWALVLVLPIVGTMLSRRRRKRRRRPYAEAPLPPPVTLPSTVTTGAQRSDPGPPHSGSPPESPGGDEQQSVAGKSVSVGQ